MPFDPDAYLKTVYGARALVEGPGALPATAQQQMARLIARTLTRIASEGDAGVITPERAAALRAALRGHLDTLAAQYGGVLADMATRIGSGVAGAHASAAAAAGVTAPAAASGAAVAGGAAAAVGAGQGGAGAALLQQAMARVPLDVLQLAMARRELGGAGTYRGLVQRGLLSTASGIDDAVGEGLARGISTRRMAQEVAAAMAQGLAEPGRTEVLALIKDGRLRAQLARTVPGSPALRRTRDLLGYGRMVAVSEANEAYRSAHILAALRSPVVAAAEWQRSGRHTGLRSSPCECDVLARADAHGLGPGRYYLEAFPAAPHPHCACTPRMVLRPPAEWDTPRPRPPADWPVPAPTDADVGQVLSSTQTTSTPPSVVTPARIASVGAHVRRTLRLGHETWAVGAKKLVRQQAGAAAAAEATHAAAVTAVEAALAATKGTDVAGLKKTIATAKALAAQARADGAAVATAKALALAQNATEQLAAKQAANKLASKKHASKKKLALLDAEAAAATTPAQLKAIAAKYSASASAAAKAGLDDVAAIALKAQAAAVAKYDVLTSVDASGFPGDLSTLKGVKTLGGSTGAELVEHVGTGKRFVRKGGASAGHLREEVASDTIYAAMGVDVPAVRLYETPTGPVKLGEFIDGVGLDVLRSTNPALYQQARKRLQDDFALDALLGNWDVAGLSYDNVLVTLTDDGKGIARVLRIDNGGSLRYRAQGGQKTALQWNESVSEITSMRGAPMPGGVVNASAKEIFGDLSDQAVATQIKGLVAKRPQLLAAATDPDVRAMLSKRLDDMEKRLPGLELAPKIIQQATAASAALGGVKGNVAGLKATIAEAKTLVAGASTTGNPLAVAAAKGLLDKAESLLQSKQLANKLSGKKHAAMKKIAAIKEQLAGADAGVLDAIEKQLAALTLDPDLALLPAALASEIGKLSSEVLAKKTFTSAVAQQVAAEADTILATIPSIAGNVAALKATVTAAQQLAQKAVTGAVDAATAAKALAALGQAEAALLAKQTKNKASGTKHKISSILAEAEAAQAAGNGAVAAAKAKAAALKLGSIEHALAPGDVATLKAKIAAAGGAAPVAPLPPAPVGAAKKKAKATPASVPPPLVAAPPAPPTKPTLAQTAAQDAALQAQQYAASGTTSYYLPKTVTMAQEALAKATASGNAYAVHVATGALESAQAKVQLVQKTSKAAATAIHTAAADEMIAALAAKAKTGLSASQKSEGAELLSHLVATGNAQTSAAAKALLPSYGGVGAKKAAATTAAAAPSASGQPGTTVHVGAGTNHDAQPAHAAGYLHHATKAGADAWGKKTHGPWAATITASEKAAIQSYKGSGYSSLNKALRSGKKPAAHHGLADLDAVLAKAEAALPVDTVVYRGASTSDWYGLTEASVGSVLVDEAFQSCSLVRSFSRNWASHRPDPILLEIRVPKGTPLPYLDAKAGLVNTNEYEVLLGRGAQLRLTGIRTEIGSYGKPIRVLEVSFEGFAPKPLK